MQGKSTYTKLRLILGDQLHHNHSWLEEKNSSILYVLMEIRPESEYVTHHIQKIVAIFSAMRSFADHITNEGHHLRYYSISSPENLHSFEKNIRQIIEMYPSIREFQFQEPDEYRLDMLISNLGLDIPITRHSSEHFLTSRDELATFFEGKKTYLMESFYRYMRKKHQILMEPSGPVTGKWNYDKSNRKKLPKNHIPPQPFLLNNNVSDLYEEIQAANLPYIGSINADKFIWPIDREQALLLLEHFIENLLQHFGVYQDAMTDHSWSLYHSRISFALNVNLLNPIEVIRRAEDSFYNGTSGIESVEGFIRQILGWREYMRGIYWAKMPQYENLNYFNHKNSLPGFFWNGRTKMNCVSKAIRQSLDYAYAHHIQRLMITGNFLLLAGIHPDEVDQWYLGIYIDAFQWVEITNTRGMSQFADGGVVATKPYISSASYISKMGDHCKNCYYDHKLKFEKRACPFNALYWNFIDQHQSLLSDNPRMSMMLNLYRKMSTETKTKHLEKAKEILENINDI